MKKLVNIPDVLFDRIKKNAEAFGWSTQQEILEMLYFSIMVRSNYVESHCGLKERSLTALEWRDNVNK